MARTAWSRPDPASTSRDSVWTLRMWESAPEAARAAGSVNLRHADPVPRVVVHVLLRVGDHHGSVRARARRARSEGERSVLCQPAKRWSGMDARTLEPRSVRRQRGVSRDGEEERNIRVARGIKPSLLYIFLQPCFAVEPGPWA
jgi:hypothetical protein